jgi:hypothetical protein
MLRIVTIIFIAFGLASMLNWADSWQFQKPAREEPQPHVEYLIKDGKPQPSHSYILRAGQKPDAKTWQAALHVSCSALGIICK